MRRLALLSFVLLALIVFASWLVYPMFVAPKQSTLDECVRCGELLGFAPDGASLVIVAPHGGTAFFELGRRIVPPAELNRLLPAPGVIAVGLGNSPVVVWEDNEGRWGAALAPPGPRRVLVKLALNKYGGGSVRWQGDILTVGEVRQGGVSAVQAALEPIRAERGHFFAVHDRPLGASVARLTKRALEIRTLPITRATGSTLTARHPVDAAFSLAVTDLDAVLAPVEKILPLKTSRWRGREGQIIIYGVDGRGLLPSIRGLVLVKGETDARIALEETVPRVEGVTEDSSRRVDGVEVFRRETLGVVVDAASKDGWLATAFDAASMDRWLTDPGRPDEGPAMWSFSSDPGELSAAVDALMESPGRHLLDSASRRTIRRLGNVIGAFRDASSVRSRLVEGPGGVEIDSRVDW